MLIEINKRFFVDNNTGYSECPLDFLAHDNLKGSKFSVKQKTNNLPAVRVFPDNCDKTLYLIYDYDWVGDDLPLWRIKLISRKPQKFQRRGPDN